MPNGNGGDPNAPSDDGLGALREALRLSPKNVPLRQHLADQLLAHGQPETVEKEYREALALAPDEAGLKLGLARAFHQQGKHSHALAVIEDLVKARQAPARAFLLYARLLAGIGEVAQAIDQYRRAVALEPSLADRELAERLGIGADDKASEVVEGKVRASWVGACWLGALLCLLAWAVTGLNADFLIAAAAFGFLVIPLAATFKCPGSPITSSCSGPNGSRVHAMTLRGLASSTRHGSRGTLKECACHPIALGSLAAAGFTKSRA